MLKRVSIQNFKSLKDVTLDLQKVNLLIGPNNAGKTNFLKALEYEGKLNANTTEENFSNLVFKKRINDRFSIELEYGKDNNTVFFICEVDKNIVFKRIDTISKSGERIRGDSSTYDSSILIKFVGKLMVYRIDPTKLIKPGPVGNGELSVSYDGSNLVGFLDFLLGRYRKTIFEEVEVFLQRCIPEFNEIVLYDSEATEDLKNMFKGKSFKKLGLTNNEQGITYWADELSEGTLYFLVLLCIINQPNPPKVLLLEEPEKGIHPRRIREVMDFIFRLAAEKDIQIILTTHNEHVLDEFSTRPESVFVFDKDEEGATYVRNLQTDIIEPTNKRNEKLGLDPIDLTTNLSENWLYGLLGGVPSIV